MPPALSSHPLLTHPPTHERQQQAVEKGEIGDVHMIHITSRDPGPPPVAYIAQVRAVPACRALCEEA